MAIGNSLTFLISFLVIRKVTAVSSEIPTPTVKPPIIITMHVGQPVTITQQSQTVTSHVPVLTVCPLDPHSNHNASCSTSYEPTVTSICSTTLSPLAAPPIPITACDQNVTFSTDHAYKIAPASGERGYDSLLMSGQEATGSVETLTIYYVAPWTDLSAGAVPTGAVEAVTCSAEGCSTQLQEWGTKAREVPLTTTQTVQFQAQVTGVSRPFCQTLGDIANHSQRIVHPANIIVGPDATTIPVSASNGTTLSYSTVVQATQTSTIITIVKSAAAAAASDISLAASGEGGDVAGADMTTTIKTTFTRTKTMFSVPGGASFSANGTAGAIT